MKKIASLLFHRVFLVAMALLVQITLLVVMMVSFSQYFVYFYWGCILISAVVVFWIVINQSEPAYKIAWIIPILAFPVFGGFMFLLFGGNKLSGRTKKKMLHMERNMDRVLSKDYKAEKLRLAGRRVVNQACYLEKVAKCPVYANTETVYFPEGELCFQRMLEELEHAERYIFMEYFIVEAGEMWDAILAVLCRKQQQGVDVRLIYDDIGCIFTLPDKYYETLRNMGIKCYAFNRFVPVVSLRLNNRNHRKFCIIDGTTAFTGGINLADEYINRKERFGHWKDSAIMVRGDAAWSMTVMFLTMWDHVTGKAENYECYRPRTLEYHGMGYVQPYVDTPLDDEAVSMAVYLSIISKAKDYVYITTPYLIISNAVHLALCNAAKSGVDVRIITPHIPDKKSVFEVTRAHYPLLLEAGVRVFEYTPGFIHAKNFVSDDKFGTVGTVNLDYRSLFLHFENGVCLYDTPSLCDIKADFLAVQAQSEEMTLAGSLSAPWWKRLYRSILQVFAPLM